ncbi:hypothetical protein [Ruminococcus sp.]|uniref:hypothetical protein n=1 Tax=Ruminococcus sp. TaxID=41978 RepID=UPI0025DFCB54|nr:hypothetical protein [Ruminococcus sp.]MCI5816930.1 hypothetical protein [Ruminococcus sp.]MDD7555667.1 hypothetical protein [Ruminococcus sp.]MDY4963554.1 hypothetical protein [Ruminococcus callidus]
MTKLDGYWAKFREYWHIKDGVVVIHDDAPKEVKESYKRYVEQADAANKRGTL